MTKKWQNSGADWAQADTDGQPTQSKDTPMFVETQTQFDPALAQAVPPKTATRRPALSGLLGDTLIETASGWQRIDTMTEGQSVQTLDGGLTRLLRLDRRMLEPSDDSVLIHLPGGCMDACSDLTLLPGQHLLVDTLDDPALEGAPFALVPALALLALNGPRRLRAEGPMAVLTPLFADEEGVYAQSGLLFHCPSLMDGAQRYPEDSFFPLLPLAQARQFLTRRAARLGA
jgi:hypothetical protein